MTVYGLDEAWQPHPSHQAAVADAYVIIFRYLSHDPGKNITTEEAAAIHAAGAAVGLVWETTADRAGHGSDAGAADVRDAEAEADSIGAPLDVCIYYAVDYDPDPNSVIAYFRSVRHGAKRPVGAYCSDAVAVELFKLGLIDFFWQTESTGFRGRWPSPIANLRQHTAYDRPKLAGDYDEDLILTADVGQWPRPSQIDEEVEMVIVRPKGESIGYLTDGSVLLPITPDSDDQGTGWPAIAELFGLTVDQAKQKYPVRELDPAHFIFKLPKVA